jgi:Nitrous oxide-stimulated promoter
MNRGVSGLESNADLMEREKRTIRTMIQIYCRGHRHIASGICSECGKLLQYALHQIDSCPYERSRKPACGLCRTNCFSAEMHKRFHKIMRYAGPRMMMRHPILSMAHFIDAVRSKMTVDKS